MKLKDLLRRPSETLSRSGQDQAEKLLVESFRTLSQVCTRLADFIDSQRLERAGFEGQGKFLERLDRKRDE
jgi:hypothetical protein